MFSTKHVGTRPINYHDRSQLTPFGTSCDHERQPSTSERARNQQNEIGGGGGLVGSLHGENKLHVFVLAKVIVKQLNKLVN